MKKVEILLLSLILLTSLCLTIQATPIINDTSPNNTIEINEGESINFNISVDSECGMYDDFSSGSLDLNKWNVKQDYQGQPFTLEYGLDNITERFHIGQDISEDRRTYLVPQYNFNYGDILKWDMDYASGSGNRLGSYLLIQKNDGSFHRDIFGIGYWNQNYGGFGEYKIKLKFLYPNLSIYVNNTFHKNYTLNLPPNELYIGSAFGGTGHFYYDNFKLCNNQTENISYEWFVDNISQNETTNNFILNSNYNSAGIYLVEVVVSNGIGNVSHSWNLTINNIVHCGDGICEGSESCSSCSQDCGSCSSSSSDDSNDDDDSSSDNNNDDESYLDENGIEENSNTQSNDSSQQINLNNEKVIENKSFSDFINSSVGKTILIVFTIILLAFLLFLLFK